MKQLIPKKNEMIQQTQGLNGDPTDPSPSSLLDFQPVSYRLNRKERNRRFTHIVYYTKWYFNDQLFKLALPNLRTALERKSMESF